jgi:hypothetical protein
MHSFGERWAYQPTARRTDAASPAVRESMHADANAVLDWVPLREARR